MFFMFHSPSLMQQNTGRCQHLNVHHNNCVLSLSLSLSFSLSLYIYMYICIYACVFVSYACVHTHTHTRNWEKFSTQVKNSLHYFGEGARSIKLQKRFAKCVKQWSEYIEQLVHLMTVNSSHIQIYNSCENTRTRTNTNTYTYVWTVVMK